MSIQPQKITFNELATGRIPSTRLKLRSRSGIMCVFSIGILALTLSAVAQTPVVFEGRRGLLLANDKVELTILLHGGSLVNLVLRDDPEKLSPFSNPALMAREMGGRGGGPVGHFVCVDGFGYPSEEERAAGMVVHGEAHRVPWELVSSGTQGHVTTLKFSARLPLVQEVFRRTFRMVDGENVIYVESELENLMAYDRPISWAEHVTIGSPFLQPAKTVVDMPAVRAQTRAYRPEESSRRRLAPGREFTWPMAPLAGGGTTDLRAAPVNPNSMDHTTCLLDPSHRLVWVTALNLEKHLLLGYVFRREEYPWLESWEDYRASLKLQRGLELSTQPFDGPRREVIQLNSMFNTPVYRWLPAKSKIGSHFLLFYVRTPEAFAKVDDVRLDNGQISIEDRAAGERITLPASLRL